MNESQNMEIQDCDTLFQEVGSSLPDYEIPHRCLVYGDDIVYLGELQEGYSSNDINVADNQTFGVGPALGFLWFYLIRSLNFILNPFKASKTARGIGFLGHPINDDRMNDSHV